MSNNYVNQNPDLTGLIADAINRVRIQDGVHVSVVDKGKSLEKFGTRTTEGTTWETVMTKVGSQLQETLPTVAQGNIIDTVASDDAADTDVDAYFEYHVLDSSNNAIFGSQTVVLQGETPVTLPTPVFRANRSHPVDVAFQGNIYYYQDNEGRDDDKTHLVVPAGDSLGADQQTQKAQTAISFQDYWFISEVALSVLSKTSAWAEARLEAKPIGRDFWLPITKNFGAKDSSGISSLSRRPLTIIRPNTDVRLVVRTNAGNIIVSGGFDGYLAKVTNRA